MTPGSPGELMRPLILQETIREVFNLLIQHNFYEEVKRITDFYTLFFIHSP